MTSFQTSLSIGDLDMPNRVFMAPLTRCRAGDGDVPTPRMAEYYRQRATAGLIITEATNVSAMSCAFEHAPGIYSAAQIEGWKAATSAVHERGGRIFLQLWHCGRVGASGILKGNEPLSPSGLNDDLDRLQVYGLLRNGQYVRMVATPSRAMTADEIHTAIEEYRVGAEGAVQAGFDGVEIHAANGYLPHQFLSPGTNRRDDDYGGPVEDRMRFLSEIVDAVGSVVPPGRVGVRISPFAAYNNPADPDPVTTYSAVAGMLEDRGVGYLHVADTNAWGGDPDMDRILSIVRPSYSGVLIGNAGMTPETAADRLAKGDLDAVAFGRSFIANPDLPERIAAGGPYNEFRSVGLYGGSEEGYTDYPDLAAIRRTETAGQERSA